MQKQKHEYHVCAKLFDSSDFIILIIYVSCNKDLKKKCLVPRVFSNCNCQQMKKYIFIEMETVLWLWMQRESF